MNEILMQGLLSAIGLAITIISGIIAYYIKQWFDIKVEKDWIENILLKIKAIIWETEKFAMKGGLKNETEKLNYAVKFVVKRLDDKEITFIVNETDMSMEDIIETELLKLQPVFETMKYNRYFHEYNNIVKQNCN